MRGFPGPYGRRPGRASPTVASSQQQAIPGNTRPLAACICAASPCPMSASPRRWATTVLTHRPIVDDGAEAGILSRRHKAVVLVSPHTPNRLIRSFPPPSTSCVSHNGSPGQWLLRTPFLGHSASRFAILGSRIVSSQIAPDVSLGLTTYTRRRGTIREIMRVTVRLSF